MLAPDAIDIRGSQRDEMEDIFVPGYCVDVESDIKMDISILPTKLKLDNFTMIDNIKHWRLCILY